MRYLILIISFGLLVLSGCSTQVNSPADVQTTYYLIRHAEKDRSNPENKDPHLTEIGQQRAQNWSNVFSDIALDAVYATAYHRTQQTAAPTAEQKGLSVQSYDPSALFDAAFQEATLGKKVLVVGHSNTTPKFVNAIIGTPTYQNIADDNNANLYIVHVHGDQTHVEVLHID